MTFIPQIIGEENKAVTKIQRDIEPEKLEKKEEVQEQKKEKKVFTSQELIQLLSSNESTVRFNAVLDLSQKNEHELVESLIKILLDKKNDLTLRCCVASALGIIGNSIATHSLIVASKDKEPLLKKYALASLAKLLEHEKENKVLTETVKKSLNDEDEDIKAYAAIKLGEQGKDEATEVLIKCLGNEDYEIQLKARELLEKSQDKNLLSLLVKSLNGESPRDLKVSALQLLSANEKEELIKAGLQEKLTELVKDSDSRVRCFTLLMLEKINAPNTFDIALNALKDKDPVVRSYACFVLRNYEKALQPLFEKLNKDEDPEVKWNAACAVRNMNSEEKFCLLIESLESPDPIVRLYALESHFDKLTNIRDNNSASVLLKAISDKKEFAKQNEKLIKHGLFEAFNNTDPGTRLVAVLAVAHADHELAIPWLIKCMLNPQEHDLIKAKAKEALDTMRLKEEESRKKLEAKEITIDDLYDKFTRGLELCSINM